MCGSSSRQQQISKSEVFWKTHFFIDTHNNYITTIKLIKCSLKTRKLALKAYRGKNRRNEFSCARILRKTLIDLIEEENVSLYKSIKLLKEQWQIPMNIKLWCIITLIIVIIMTITIRNCTIWVIVRIAYSTADARVNISFSIIYQHLSFFHKYFFLITIFMCAISHSIVN